MKLLRIAHCGDVHIFFHKRHEEHKELITTFTDILKREKVDLIYVGGDVIDSKSKLSAEQIEIVNYFFYSLSAIAPVIVILGNHDMNLQAKTKLDALSPIINNIHGINPIYYLKDSGVYNLYDIDWLVWSRIDDKDPIETYIKKHYAIGCYHGPIKGAKTDSGWDKFSSNISEKTFDRCDIVLLNDIHKTQYFRNKEIAYSGSFLQTKIDESYKKGFLLWEWNSEIKKHEPTFVQVPNKFGYRTFEISDLEKFDITKVELPSQDFVCRLLYTGSEDVYSFTKFNEYKKQLKAKFPNQILLQKRFNKRKVIIDAKKTVKSKDFLFDYLKERNINKELIIELKKLDEYYNSLVSMTDYHGNEYYISELEIHNFLCFGPKNIIDFEEYKGLSGLFGENGIGKSSLFHAIMFCLFNKTPKNTKSSIKLINDQLEEVDKSYVQVKLNIGGVNWRIKRSIIPKSDDSGANIKLEVYEEDIPRHLDSRPQTDKQVLQPLLGDEYIFLTTVLSSQKDPIEFVDNDNAKRLDLVIKFLGILLYDTKFNLVTKDLKQEELVRGILNTELEKLTSLQELEKTKKETEEDIEDRKKKIEETKEQIVEQIKEQKSLAGKLSKLNIVGVIKTEEELNKDLNSYQSTLKTKEEKLVKEKENRKNLLIEWNKDEELKGKLNEWKPKKTDKEKESKVSELRVEIKNLQIQLTSENHTITCPHCNHQWQEINKEQIKLDIENKRIEKDILQDELDTFENKQLEIEELKNNILNSNKTIQGLEEEIIEVKEDIEEVKEHLKTIETNKEKIKKKAKVEKDLEKLNSNLETNKEFKSSEETIVAVKEEQVKSLIEKIKTYNEKVAELETKDILINNLTIYKNAMHRSGIPSMILQNFIPLINFEINNYINELFDFSVKFELEESSLNIYYIKENLNKIIKRNITQACGQESTVINLAIRAALTKISLLPKPSLLLLDEVFSMLDDKNLEKMHDLVIRLKEQYQNIILITHTAEIKDWPEYFISLSQTNGITTIG